MPKILSGPYGSLIDDKLAKQGSSERERKTLTHPTAILHKPRTKDLIRDVAKAYRDSGADLLTTNTFSSRKILNGNDRDLYPYVVRQHLDVIQRIAKERNEIAISFGPYGDCYIPKEGPSTVAEGQDFWETAFEPLLSYSGKLNYALAETVNTGTEAIAIAKAWQKIHRYNRGKIQGVISFIPEKKGINLLSGERIAEVIKALHAEVGALPILFGLNCCAAEALEPTLRDVTDDQDVSSHDAQFRFIYPNASDKDYQELEQTPENKVSHPPEKVGQVLSELIQKYEHSLPGAASHVFVNECCGGTPERTGIISHHVHTGAKKVQVS
jgi:methionine synthase I (cobalamin-dependent)